jgi:hypothetical protein
VGDMVIHHLSYLNSCLVYCHGAWRFLIEEDYLMKIKAFERNNSITPSSLILLSLQALHSPLPILMLLYVYVTMTILHTTTSSACIPTSVSRFSTQYSMLSTMHTHSPYAPNMFQCTMSIPPTRLVSNNREPCYETVQMLESNPSYWCLSLRCPTHHELFVREAKLSRTTHE